jgi:hypothetical protein
MTTMTIGVDLHKRESQLCLLAADGTASERRIVTSRERLTAVLGAQPSTRVLLRSQHGERVGRPPSRESRSHGDRRQPARILAPLRQHEGMNRQRCCHSLDLNPGLLTQSNSGELELSPCQLQRSLGRWARGLAPKLPPRDRALQGDSC